MKIIVTGGAGFIGSAVCRYLTQETDHTAINIDKLTYAASLESLEMIADDPRYTFEKANICDKAQMESLFERHQPDAVMNLAAESHVDRSIDGPADFIETNILGTYNLLTVALDYWTALDASRQKAFRFHQISTDEVYGSLGPTGAFLETTPYAPNSPYSSSKASADHLVRAWHHTYGLPVVTSNCSNNYGPYQFPEKLIPHTILNALDGKALPVYGKGDNIRDWLHVEDHAEALYMVLSKGLPGETYNVGGDSERTNIVVVRDICTVLDELLPDSPHRPHEDLITFVEDRPGHDKRYAIDSSKIQSELGWTPNHSFEAGLRDTVSWYLENRNWWQTIQARGYKVERLGLGSGTAPGGPENATEKA